MIGKTALMQINSGDASAACVKFSATIFAVHAQVSTRSLRIAATTTRQVALNAERPLSDKLDALAFGAEVHP